MVGISEAFMAPGGSGPSYSGVGIKYDSNGLLLVFREDNILPSWF
jgi:hypothetical protein